MVKTCLYAISGVVLSASLSFAQAGGGAGSMGRAAGGAIDLGGSGGRASESATDLSGSDDDAGSRGSMRSPGPSLPDPSTDPLGSMGSGSRTGRLSGDGSDDGTAAAPDPGLPRSMDGRGLMSPGFGGSGDRPDSDACSMAR